jgi:DNA-binding transcriptional LysR family regulator
MPMIPLNALRSFETAARLNSISKAADELCVTQSAVSHQIKKLEDWLGMRLFLRNKGGLELLPEGQELAHTLTLSIGQIERSCREIRSKTKPQPIVIAAIPAIAAIWLVPRLDSFRQQHPDIEIRIEYALHGQAVDFSEVDFAFTFSNHPPTAANTKSRIYLSGASCAVCNPTVAAVAGVRDLDIEAMQNVGLLHDTDMSGWTSWFLKATSKVPMLETGLTYHDFNLLRAATLAGQGIALCPQSIIQSDLESGHLVQLSDIFVGEEFNYYMTRSEIRRSSQSSASAAFEEWALNLSFKRPNFG